MTETDASDIQTGKAYRIRSNHNINHDRPRSIFVKFTTLKQKELIITACKQTKPVNYYINDDYSTRVLQRRKELLPELKKARSDGKIAYFSLDRLVVRERNN